MIAFILFESTFGYLNLKKAVSLIKALEILKCSTSAAIICPLTCCLKDLSQQVMVWMYTVSFEWQERQSQRQPFWMGCFKSQIILEVLENKSDQNICLKEHFNYVCIPVMSREAFMPLGEWFLIFFIKYIKSMLWEVICFLWYAIKI